MKDKELSKLLVSKAEASVKIQERINIGTELHNTSVNSEDQLENLKRKTKKWIAYNHTLFETLFDKSPLSPWIHGFRGVYLTNTSLNYDIDEHKGDILKWNNDLESIYERLDLYEELPKNTEQTMNNENKKIFIGHGCSLLWRELKDFIEGTLRLPYEEFNRVSTAGQFTGNRLKEMLDESCMAFLIMTGEDEQADGSLHARENVIHEAGLFQGRLGFEKAIILLEEGCKDFSNIHGLIHIPFPKGKIGTAFEEIRRVLKRESILE